MRLFKNSSLSSYMPLEPTLPKAKLLHIVYIFVCTYTTYPLVLSLERDLRCADTLHRLEVLRAVDESSLLV